MTVTIEGDGTTVWTFPSGRVYRLPPTRVLEHPDLDPEALRAALRALTEDSDDLREHGDDMSIRVVDDVNDPRNARVIELKNRITRAQADRARAGDSPDAEPDPAGTDPDPPSGPERRPPPPEDDVPPF